MKPTPNDLANLSAISMLLAFATSNQSAFIPITLAVLSVAYYVVASRLHRKENERKADETLRKLALQVHNYIKVRQGAAFNCGLLPPPPESIYNDIKVDGFTYEDYLKHRPQ